MPTGQGQTLLDVNFDEIPEFETLDAGEYRLRISDAEIRTKESTGNKFILLRMNAIEYDNAEDVTDVFMLDGPDYDDRRRKKALARLRDFCDDMDIPYGPQGLDMRDFEGKEVWAVLDKTEDPEYGESNNVVRYVSAA
jgi:hypothetical protein